MTSLTTIVSQIMERCGSDWVKRQQKVSELDADYLISPRPEHVLATKNPGVDCFAFQSRHMRISRFKNLQRTLLANLLFFNGFTQILVAGFQKRDLVRLHPGYWKMNAELASNENILTSINAIELELRTKYAGRNSMFERKSVRYVSSATYI